MPRKKKTADWVTIEDEAQLKYIQELFSNSQGEAGGQIKSIRKDVVAAVDENLIDLFQPKSVTYSLMEKNPTTKLIIIEVVKNLQAHMSTDPRLLLMMKYSLNLWVKMDFKNFPYYAEHPGKIPGLLERLEHQRFFFSWTQKSYTDASGELHKERIFDFEGFVFTGHSSPRGSLEYSLQLNPMAVPYFLFIGKGMGFTKYEYQVAFRISRDTPHSVYPLSLYLLVCEWASQEDVKHISLDDLYDLLSVPASNRNITRIRTEVLELTSSLLSKHGASVNYTYELKKQIGNGTTLGRLKYEGIVFTFVKGKSAEKREMKKERNVKALVAIITEIADAECLAEVEPFARAVVERGDFKKLYDKFVYYNGLVAMKEMSRNEYCNTILKICREDYGVELRSPMHIINSKRKLLKVKGVTDSD